MKLTSEERSAIRTLQRLQQRWSPSLWLYAGDGMLYVMKKTEDGERMVKMIMSIRLGSLNAFPVSKSMAEAGDGLG